MPAFSRGKNQVNSHVFSVRMHSTNIFRGVQVRHCARQQGWRDKIRRNSNTKLQPSSIRKTTCISLSPFCVMSLCSICANNVRVDDYCHLESLQFPLEGAEFQRGRSDLGPRLNFWSPGFQMSNVSVSLTARYGRGQRGDADENDLGRSGTVVVVSGSPDSKGKCWRYCLTWWGERALWVGYESLAEWHCQTKYTNVIDNGFPIQIAFVLQIVQMPYDLQSIFTSSIIIDPPRKDSGMEEGHFPISEMYKLSLRYGRWLSRQGLKSSRVWTFQEVRCFHTFCSSWIIYWVRNRRGCRLWPGSMGMVVTLRELKKKGDWHLQSITIISIGSTVIAWTFTVGWGRQACQEVNSILCDES